MRAGNRSMGDERDLVVAGEPGHHLEGAVLRVAEEDARGSRARDDPAQRPRGLAAPDQLSELGAEVDRGVLQVVVQRARQAYGLPARQGGQQLSRRSRPKWR